MVGVAKYEYTHVRKKHEMLWSSTMNFGIKNGTEHEQEIENIYKFQIQLKLYNSDNKTMH